MNAKTPLSHAQKLTILCRVEPGCLGPTGASLVDGFCVFAQPRLEAMDPEVVNWKLVPRKDKLLPEMHYQMGNKVLTYDQAGKYLSLFGKEIEDYEEDFHGVLANLVNEHLGR